MPRSLPLSRPALIAIAAVGVLLLIVLVVSRWPRTGEAGAGDAAAQKSAPADRCASQATYDRIKVELFRKAAQIRGSDQGLFDRLSAYGSVRVERPLLRDRNPELGTIRCTGQLSLDLPPGLAVVGGRRALSAEIDYVLQPAADGSGDVVMLEGVDPITVPLATLARTGETAQLPAAPPPPVADPQQPVATDFGVRTPPETGLSATPPAPAPTASARPSFNCRYARTRGEIAVCSDGGLAALDRQMAGQYYRALANANARERALLRTTRDAFLRYRDRCSTNACIAASYRDRMREIRDIMAGQWRPND